MPDKDTFTVERVVWTRKQKEPIILCRNGSKSVCRSSIKERVESDHSDEITVNTESLPRFNGKWQFPKYVNNYNQKYLSL